MLDSANSPVLQVDGAQITDGYQNLSHHGKSEKKLSQLGSIDRERNTPLPNLFVSMLQQMGLEVDRFASSTGTLRGQELR